MVELKGWHGSIGGNQFYWSRHLLNGTRVGVANPLKFADDKAKRLRSLLDRAKAHARLPHLHVPHVVPHGA